MKYKAIRTDTEVVTGRRQAWGGQVTLYIQWLCHHSLRVFPPLKDKFYRGSKTHSLPLFRQIFHLKSPPR